LLLPPRSGVPRWLFFLRTAQIFVSTEYTVVSSWFSLPSARVHFTRVLHRWPSARPGSNLLADFAGLVPPHGFFSSILIQSMQALGLSSVFHLGSVNLCSFCWWCILPLENLGLAKGMSRCSSLLQFFVCAWERHLARLLARPWLPCVHRQGALSIACFDSDFALKCLALELVCVSYR
jgi:hypothetical protein